MNHCPALVAQRFQLPPNKCQKPSRKSRVFLESYDFFKLFVHSFDTARFILRDTATGSFQLPYLSARRVPDKAGSTAKLKVGNCPFERGDAEIIRNVSRSILES